MVLRLTGRIIGINTRLEIIKNMLESEKINKGKRI